LTVVILVSGILLCTDKLTRADSDSDLLRKLDEIVQSQKSILSGIEALKQELNIVKIRVTQQQ